MTTTKKYITILTNNNNNDNPEGALEGRVDLVARRLPRLAALLHVT